LSYSPIGKQKYIAIEPACQIAVFELGKTELDKNRE